MRIGFDAKRAFLNTSGLGNFSRNTLNALQRYYPKYNYTLFTPEIKPGMLEQQNEFEIVDPEGSNSGLKKSIWRSFQLSNEIANRELNLFHGLSNELPRGIHKLEIPSVVTVHDLIFLRYPEFYKTLDRAIYLRKTKYACTVASKVHAISQQTKADLLNFIDTDPDKIEIINQSVSPAFFQNVNTRKVKEKYQLPDEFILTVGTIEERKNQLVILKALKQGSIKIPIVFVGKPTTYIQTIRKLIDEMHIHKQVLFFENIPENDLVGFYQLANLSIYISVFEGFGLPVIESMACGCPVITSNISCLPETADDAAVLCSPDNIEQLGHNIQQLLNDSSFRNEFILKGRIRANDFQPAKYVEKLIALYAKLTTH